MIPADATVYHWTDEQHHLHSQRIPKAQWGEGPWTTEPDKVSWTDEVTGLPCLIVRGPSGSLCGYVGVDETHPLHGKPPYDFDNNDGADQHIDAHGGVNYGGACQDEADQAIGVCHIAQPGEGHRWWFGFDCAHAGDYSPSLHATMRNLPSRDERSRKILESYDAPYDHAKAVAAGRWDVETYRTVDYVAAQCESLAYQLVATAANWSETEPLALPSGES